MVVTTVVWHNVHHDLDPNLPERLHHLVKVLECTDVRVDIPVIGNII